MVWGGGCGVREVWGGGMVGMVKGICGMHGEGCL